MECSVASQKILLLLYGELDPAERLEIERHIEACQACGVVLAEERRLQAILNQRPSLDPPAELLRRCREDLSDALAPARSAAGAVEMFPLRRFLAWPHRLLAQARVSPAFAAALLMVGFLAGFFAVGRPAPAGSGRPAGSIDSDVTGVALNLRAIDKQPDSDRVRLQYDTMERASLEGSIDDPQVRSILLSTLNDSINAGLRLDAIELLRHRADDLEVRTALLRAIGDDSNPSARLRAIEALDDQTASDSQVRQAVTRALLEDTNPGVRVRAFDTLARAASPETMTVFERLARDDANEYVRMRSAAVVDALYRPEDR